MIIALPFVTHQTLPGLHLSKAMAQLRSRLGALKLMPTVKSLPVEVMMITSQRIDLMPLERQLTTSSCMELAQLRSRAPGDLVTQALVTLT